MKSIKNYTLLLLIFQTCLVASAQVDVFELDIIPAQKPENLDIYLLIGQSNMAGRAAIRETESIPIEDCFLFTGDVKTPWVNATNPLNRYSTVRKTITMQRLNPGYSFARTMTAENPDNIGLVVNAKGGTKIVQWLPGTELFEAAIQQTRKALRYGNLKGILWLQGEGDCHPLRVEMYLGHLEILINALREEFNAPDLPFIASQLYETEKRHAFNEMILQLPGFIKNTGVVSSEGTSTFDGTHFDSESAILLGNRYAKELKKLQLKMNF